MKTFLKLIGIILLCGGRLFSCNEEKKDEISIETNTTELSTMDTSENNDSETIKKEASLNKIETDDFSFLIPDYVVNNEDDKSAVISYSLYIYDVKKLIERGTNCLPHGLYYLIEDGKEITSEAILSLYKEKGSFVLFDDFPMSGTTAQQHEQVILNGEIIGDACLEGITGEGLELSGPARYHMEFILGENIYRIMVDLDYKTSYKQDNISKIIDLVDLSASQETGLLTGKDSSAKKTFANLVWTGDKSVPQRFYDLFSAWEEIKNSIQLTDGTKIEFR